MRPIAFGIGRAGLYRIYIAIRTNPHTNGHRGFPFWNHCVRVHCASRRQFPPNHMQWIISAAAAADAQHQPQSPRAWPIWNWTNSKVKWNILRKFRDMKSHVKRKIMCRLVCDQWHRMDWSINNNKNEGGDSIVRRIFHDSNSTKRNVNEKYVRFHCNWHKWIVSTANWTMFWCCLDSFDKCSVLITILRNFCQWPTLCRHECERARNKISSFIPVERMVGCRHNLVCLCVMNCYNNIQ